jgi:DNA-binding NarL/FixJ family response regulator
MSLTTTDAEPEVPRLRPSAAQRDSRADALRVVTVADEPLAGQALSVLLGQYRVIRESKYCGPAGDWRRTLGAGADAVIWFGGYADRSTLEFVDRLRRRDADLAVCLVVQGIEVGALRDVVRAGAAQFGVVVRSAELDVRGVLKSLLQLRTGHVALAPQILEQLIADADVRSSALDGLSPGEAQVLELIAGGLRNREIARRLHMHEKVVERHVTRIFTKLNLRREEDHIDRRVMAARTFLLRSSQDEQARADRFTKRGAPDG